MTFVGGIGHTLAFLILDFHVATSIAFAVAAVELAAIAWIRKRYIDTPLLKALAQAVGGGILVFLTGILLCVSDEFSSFDDRTIQIDQKTADSLR
jgi:uncharacterized membrane protein YjjB (DUF3815 family)